MGDVYTLALPAQPRRLKLTSFFPLIQIQYTQNRSNPIVNLPAAAAAGGVVVVFIFIFLLPYANVNLAVSLCGGPRTRALYPTLSTRVALRRWNNGRLMLMP